LLLNVGVVRNRMGQPVPAQDMLRRSLALRERLVREHPEEGDYRIELASSHGELAIALAGSLHVEAVENFRRAIAVLREGGERLMEQSNFLKAELIHQTNLGMLLKALGKEDEAKKCQERVSVIKMKLAEMLIP
jgi:hypothetical protein